MGHQRDYSEDVASEIDSEVRRFIDEAHDEAYEILVQYRDVLDDMVLQLMEKETLSREQVLEIFAPVVKRPSRGTWRGNGGKRRPSDRPPVMTPAELALLGANGAGPRGRTSRRTSNGTSNGTGTTRRTTTRPKGARSRQTPPLAEG
jgi:cell division protease FtsH